MAASLKLCGNDENFCGNCEKQTQKTSATAFCRDCNQYQCDDCAKGHVLTVLSTVKQHKVLPIAELKENEVGGVKELRLGKLEFCSEHLDKEIDFMCEDEKKFCCALCAFRYHRTCKQVTEIKELGQLVKEGDRPLRLNAQMCALQTQLGDITKTLEQNLSDIGKQTKSIAQEISEVRNKIVTTVDQLLNVVTSESQRKGLQYTKAIKDKITSIRKLEGTILQAYSQLETLIKYGTDGQIFIMVTDLEEQVQKLQKEVQGIHGSTMTAELRLALDNNFHRVFQASNNLATVSVETSNLKPYQFPISMCVMEKMPLIDIQKKQDLDRPWYTGAEYLSDGQLVAADGNNNLCCLLDESFNVTASVRLPSNPTNLAVIGPSQIVIVLPETKQLQFVTVNGTDLILTEIISCSRTPQCVSFILDKKLLVGFETGMGVIDLAGKEKLYLDKDQAGAEIKFSFHDRVKFDSKAEIVYHSSWNENIVKCLNLSGEVNFTYSNNMSRPCGMALDREGNLYICSFDTPSIHQVNPAGQLISIIDNIMHNPYTVCFNPAGDTMTVINSGTSKGSKVRFVPPELQQANHS